GGCMETSERAFFTRIKKAITLNPFSRERLVVDLELAEMSTAGSKAELFGKLNHRIENSIAKITERNRRAGKRLSPEDNKLFLYGFLFQTFYLYCDDYDRLIQEQLLHGVESCTVSFAGEVIKRLTGFGFSRAEALRFFALFFQMRRAFFFIEAIAGESACVQELRMRLWNNVFTNNIEMYDTYLWNRMEDFSSMLLGETGTGKGLAAAAIGRSGFIPFDEKMGCFSESFGKTFVSINLSQFPEQLIESELFGHRKGAFTGAIEPHKGIFSRCSPHGAIFIDEIGDVSIPVQIKLLQVLQEREFSPVGSHKKERFQGRVIAATNQPLAAMRREGKFREDFYYRLCSDVIEVPPLRQRLDENPGEIRVILSFIIKRILGRTSDELVEEIGRFIIENQPANYLWPGNIRELEQCVRQILLHQSYTWQETEERNEDQFCGEIKEGKLTAHQLLAYYCKKLYNKLGTYEAVGRLVDLDRRTVKKYVKGETIL
ncbi:MAG: sigma-54-dependent transcriptional regulator, partial [Desulforhopalus sp.]